MLKVGITGGIGAGKSIVAKIFECLSVPVYYSDRRAKYLMETDKTIINFITNTIGSESYLCSSKLNVDYLRKQLFSISELRLKLEYILHPLVLKDYYKWIKRFNTCYYSIHESAILFEKHIDRFLDLIIVVYSPLDIRVKRVISRGNISIKEVNFVVASQIADKEKIAMANYVIRNDETSLVLPQILNIHNKLMRTITH